MAQGAHGMFAVRGRLSPRADWSFGLGSIALLVAVWCGITFGHLASAYFLPSPVGVWDGLVDFYKKGWLLSAMGLSFLRVTISLVLVVAIGTPIGVLMGAFAPVHSALGKIVNGAKSIPTTGIIPLIVLWFSISETAKIVFLFVGSIFYMIVLVENAVMTVREEYLRVALDLGASRWQLITKVLFWGALPQIWDAITVCNGIMWTYIVLAEFINGSEANLGLGYLLQIGLRLSSAGRMFAALVVIAVISSSTDFLLQRFRRRYLNW